MKIAICDDDVVVCNAIEEILKTKEAENRLDFGISIFYDASRLVSDINRGIHFDLIFLDIEMPGVDGIQAGIAIRAAFPHCNPQIVYISSHDNYAMQLFAMRPLHFLLKPVTESEVRGVINTCMQLMKKEDQYFSYTFERNKYRVRICDIRYFESKGRKVRIVHLDGSDLFYSTIRDLSECRCISNSFIQVHKSFLVNRSHINEFHHDHVVLTSGENIPISQNRRKVVRELICKSMEGELG